MNNLKCSNCGLVSWKEQITCPRCNTAFGGVSGNDAIGGVPAFNSRKLIIYFAIFLILVPLGYGAGVLYTNWKNAGGEYKRSHGSGSLEKPETFVPSSGTIADVMVLSGSDRFNTLSQKFEEGIQKNKDWWLNYVKQAPVGMPLPYHPNLNLSEDEYDEYLSETLTLKKIGETRLTVKQEKPQRFSISADSKVPHLSGIVVDFAKRQIETSLGVGSIQDRIVASPKQVVTTPWDGIEWSSLTINDDVSELHGVKFSLGKFQEGNKGLLRYEGVQINESKVVQRFSIVLVYEFN